MMDGSGQCGKRKEQGIGHSDAFKVTCEFVQFEADLILLKNRPHGPLTKNTVILKENMQD